MKYHVHITSEEKVSPRGFKLTSIILEKQKIIEKHNMFTMTYNGTNDVDKDIKDIIKKYSHKFTNIQRFKIELLDNPQYVNEYTEKNYREIHIKIKLPTQYFNLTKTFLNNWENRLGFSLSNNPKEVSNNMTTQFINMRFLSGTFKESEEKLSKVISLLQEASSKYEFKIGEIKEELSVYDTNFTLDRWWAH